MQQVADGLNVRTVPAVFLVSGGHVMDTFTGVPSEERILDFVNTAKLLEQLTHDSKTIDSVIEAGEEHVKLKDYHTAIEVFKQSLKSANFSELQESRILLNIAMCYAKQGMEMEAKESHLKWKNKYRYETLNSHCQSMLDEYEESMREILSGQEEDEVLQAMEEKLSEDPENCALMLEIAQHCFEKERFQESIDY